MKLSIEQVATAMELRNEGVHLQNLAVLMGTTPATLTRYLYNAERYGFSFWTQHPNQDVR